MKLYAKETATFNDGITLIKLLYNEKDHDDVFINNILWAAGKRLFKVSIPIKSEEINPVLTRREFAYWILKVFNSPQGLVNRKTVTKYGAYRMCVSFGIIDKGRGPFDSFTGKELMDTFSYLDYYVRYNDIRPKKGVLEIPDDTYKNLPEWREKLHRELDEQREKEMLMKERKKEIKKQERLDRLRKLKEKQKYIETNTEKKIEE